MEKWIHKLPFFILAFGGGYFITRYPEQTLCLITFSGTPSLQDIVAGIVLWVFLRCLVGTVVMLLSYVRYGKKEYPEDDYT